MTQLDITGGEHPLAKPALTERQQFALGWILARHPVASDELGAVLHADRLLRGGRGHSADSRCDFCTDEGKQMGAALRRKGLVRYRRGHGWVPTDAASQPASDTAQGGLPEGY